MKRGNINKGLLKAMIDVIKLHGIDGKYESNWITKEISNQRLYHFGSAKTPERTVNMYFNQNHKIFEKSISGAFSLKEEFIASHYDYLEIEITIDPRALKDHESMNFEDAVSLEGARKERRSIVYERDPALRKVALYIHGTTCKSCGFDFEDHYGELGRGFIEMHHTNPLALRGGVTETKPEKDLVPLCSNCHRMVHRRKGIVLSIEELQSHLKTRANQAGDDNSE